MKSRQPRGQPGCAEGRIHYLLPPPPLSSYSSGQFQEENKREKILRPGLKRKSQKKIVHHHPQARFAIQLKKPTQM